MQAGHRFAGVPDLVKASRQRHRQPRCRDVQCRIDSAGILLPETTLAVCDHEQFRHAMMRFAEASDLQQVGKPAGEFDQSCAAHEHVLGIFDHDARAILCVTGKKACEGIAQCRAVEQDGIQRGTTDQEFMAGLENDFQHTAAQGIACFGMLVSFFFRVG